MQVVIVDNFYSFRPYYEEVEAKEEDGEEDTSFLLAALMVANRGGRNGKRMK